MDWDIAIALAYAAEQLFIAAQALTSDLVSTEQGLAVADARMGALLDNGRFLPPPISQRVRTLHAAYVNNRGTRCLEPRVAGALAQQTLSVLSEIRDVLANVENRRVAA